MCVAVTGKVVGLRPGTGISVPGRVDFGRGLAEPVELMMVPEVRVGDWVVVHSGYALRVVDPSRTWSGDSAADLPEVGRLHDDSGL